jgi:hypothetical protein
MEFFQVRGIGKNCGDLEGQGTGPYFKLKQFAREKTKKFRRKRFFFGGRGITVPQLTSLLNNKTPGKKISSRGFKTIFIR